MPRTIQFPLSPVSPLSQEDLPPDSPLDLFRDDDSPLSTLSPQSSFETNEAQYGVKYSWSGGTSTIDDRVSKSEEMGQEVSVTINSQEVVAPEPMYGATPRSGTASMYDATPKAGTARRFEDTPKAGTARRFEATPKAGTASRFEDTPKAGTASRNSGPRRNRGDNQRSDNAEDENDLSTPSWDIDQTFSFRKKEEKKQESRHQPQPSQSSFSGIWDFINAIGLSRSESMSPDEEGATIKGDSSNEVDRPPRLTESMENDLFAQEVGLML